MARRSELGLSLSLAWRRRELQNLMLDAAFALLLRLVHEGIDPANHEVDVAHLATKRDGADAECHRPALARHLEGQHRLQPIQQCQHSLGVDLGHEQGELIAAEPGEQVGIAQMEVNRLDDLRQGGVADRMAKLVVEIFEIVNVKIGERQVPRGAVGSFTFDLDGFVKSSAIGGAGQRVGARQQVLAQHGSVQARDQARGQDQRPETNDAVPDAGHGRDHGVFDAIDPVPGHGPRQREDDAGSKTAPPGADGNWDQVEDAERQIRTGAVIQDGDERDKNQAAEDQKRPAQAFHEYQPLLTVA